jgi:signal transduction histidine kinase/ligand-binding sensor domain-containing protein
MAEAAVDVISPEAMHFKPVPFQHRPRRAFRSRPPVRRRAARAGLRTQTASFLIRVGYTVDVNDRMQTRLSSIVRALTFCAVLLAFMIPPVARAEWADEYREFVIRSWEIRDGLPYSHIRGVTQRKNGFIWVVSKTGAARFDGVEFKLFNKQTDPNISDNRMTTLHEDRFGVLYIGHETGAVTFRKGADFISLAPHEELSGVPVTRFVETEDGVVWAVFQSGQFAIAGREGMPSSVLEPVRQLPKELQSALDSGWRVLDGDIVLLKDREVTATRGNILWKHGQKVSFLELSDGSLVAGLSPIGGVVFYSPDGEVRRLDVAQGLRTENVLCIHEDNDGTLWVGTSGGLQSVRLKRAEQIKVELKDYEKLRIIEPRASGGLWAASAWSLKHVAPGTRHVAWLDQPPHSFRKLYQDRSGKVWCGSVGAFISSRKGGVFVPEDPPDHKADEIWDFTESPDGVLWAAGDRGVWKRSDSGWLLEAGEEKGIRNVRCVAAATNGTLWIGTATAGLFSLSGGEVVRIDTGSGLNGVQISALHLDEDRGSVWVGTCGNGLLQLENGNLVATAFPQRIISSIVADDLGRLWMITEDGVTIIGQQELAGHKDRLRPVLLDDNDGVSPSMFIDEGYSTACRLSDGRVAVMAGQSVLLFKPEEIIRHKEPVPVVFTELVVNGKTRLITPGKPNLLPPGVNHLSIRYSALEFIAPGHIKFLGRMVGSDDSWIDLEGSREASFPKLPPGSYRFELLATNRDGELNPSSKVLHIIIQPFFWQTGWFKLLIYLSAAGLLGLLIYIVSERIHRRQVILAKQLQAVEEERNRIALDVHDQVGSEVTRINLICDHFIRAFREQNFGNADRHIHELDRVASRLVRSLDEIVWIVRPSNDNVKSMLLYIAKYTERFMTDSRMDCRLDIPLELPDQTVSGGVRHELFLCVKEALNNVVKHARATAVLLEATFEGANCILSIHDNGIGIDAQQDAMFKRGLESMLERMAKVGGTFSVESNETGGATIRLSLPLLIL